MHQETYQLASAAAQLYEDQKVRSVFAPLARATIEAVPIVAGDRVLDVACGTGIVARTICETYGASVEVTGSDLSEGMIEVAKQVSKSVTPPVDWVVANAVNLPFENESFSVCFCQQGIQFFPEKQAALMEIRRVLVPGGRLALTVWDGASPFFVAMANALRRNVSAEAATKSLAPFSYDGGNELPPLLAEAGYVDITARRISVDRVVKQPRLAIPKDIFGSPVGAVAKEKGQAAMERIVNEIMAECAEFGTDASLVIPQPTHLFMAKASDPAP